MVTSNLILIISFNVIFSLSDRNYNILRPASLSELTPYEIRMKLTHLGLKTFILLLWFSPVSYIK